MTIAIAWLRCIKGSNELVFASDSRLNGGVRWDQCPKMLLLPRSDCAICFAGSSHYTYPLMVQLSFAISSYRKSKERGMDLFALKGHIRRVFNSLESSIYFDPSYPSITRENELKGTEFIFGGYSWQKRCFAFWHIKYNVGLNKFDFERPKSFGKYGPIVFAGDWAADAKTMLVNRIIRKMGEKSFIDSKNQGFDMEPFDALVELLNSKRGNMNITIGGPPQVIKIYQHMNSVPMGVYWKTKNDQVIKTLLGRTLLDYEDCDCRFLNPLNLTIP